MLREVIRFSQLLPADAYPALEDGACKDYPFDEDPFAVSLDDKLAILDNCCWPGTDNEEAMGQLVRACEACRDAALAYGIPFISGKDSLHNQFTNSETGEVIRIPNTLLISAIGVIDDVRKCVTMDLKNRTARVVLVAARDAKLETLAATHRALAPPPGSSTPRCGSSSRA